MTKPNNFAEQLSDCLMRKSDIDVEIKGIIEAAKEEGINVRALRKVAKELITDASKLAKTLEDERQIDMFRTDVGLFKRKGLDAMREAAE